MLPQFISTLYDLTDRNHELHESMILCKLNFNFQDNER